MVDIRSSSTDRQGSGHTRNQDKALQQLLRCTLHSWPHIILVRLRLSCSLFMSRGCSGRDSHRPFRRLGGGHRCNSDRDGGWWTVVLNATSQLSESSLLSGFFRKSSSAGLQCVILREMSARIPCNLSDNEQRRHGFDLDRLLFILAYTNPLLIAVRALLPVGQE